MPDVGAEARPARGGPARAARVLRQRRRRQRGTVGPRHPEGLGLLQRTAPPLDRLAGPARAHRQRLRLRGRRPAAHRRQAADGRGSGSWLVGQPRAPGLGPVQEWVVDDPQRGDFPARRARLRREGRRLLPRDDVARVPDPYDRRAVRGGQVEGVIWHDVEVDRRPAHRPAARQGRARAPFARNVAVARSPRTQRNVSLATIALANGGPPSPPAGGVRGGGAAHGLPRATPGDLVRSAPVRQERPSGGRAGRRPRRAALAGLAGGRRGRRRYASAPRATAGTWSDPAAVADAGAPQWKPSVAAGEASAAVIAFIDERERSADDDLPEATSSPRGSPAAARSPPRALDPATPPVELAAKYGSAQAPSAAAQRAATCSSPTCTSAPTTGASTRGGQVTAGARGARTPGFAGRALPWPRRATQTRAAGATSSTSTTRPAPLSAVAVSWSPGRSSSSALGRPRAPPALRRAARHRRRAAPHRPARRRAGLVVLALARGARPGPHGHQRGRTTARASRTSASRSRAARSRRGASATPTPAASVAPGARPRREHARRRVGKILDRAPLDLALKAALTAHGDGPRHGRRALASPMIGAPSSRRGAVLHRFLDHPPGGQIFTTIAP